MQWKRTMTEVADSQLSSQRFELLLLDALSRRRARYFARKTTQKALWAFPFFQLGLRV